VFESIIVPLDGTPEAEVALGPAVELIARQSGTLALLSVTGSDEGVAARERYLMEVAERLEVTANAVALVAGRPGAAIAGYAADHGPALVCMASHGQGRLATALFGSVTTEVVRAGVAPVLVVGPQYLASPKPWSEVVVPLDGSANAAAAVPVATALADVIGAPLQLVEVLDPDQPQVMDDAEIAADVLEDAMLRRVAQGLRAGGVEAEWEVLHDRSPAKGLHRYLTGLERPLVVMATHGRTGLAVATAGSVATALVHDATYPVVLIRPTELVGTDTDPSTSSSRG